MTTYYRGFDEERGNESKQTFTYSLDEIEDMEELIENIREHQGYEDD